MFANKKMPNPKETLIKLILWISIIILHLHNILD
jgi:hypothetical protein